MAIAYNFLLSNQTGPKIPHLLVLTQNERTGRFIWSYFAIQGKFVPKGQPPLASGDDVRFGLNKAVHDLYFNGNPYGTLTLKKAINNLVVGETGEFVSFTGNRHLATFTWKGPV